MSPEKLDTVIAALFCLQTVGVVLICFFCSWKGGSK